MLCLFGHYQLVIKAKLALGHAWEKALDYHLTRHIGIQDISWWESSETGCSLWASTTATATTESIWQWWGDTGKTFCWDEEIDRLDDVDEEFVLAIFDARLPPGAGARARHLYRDLPDLLVVRRLRKRRLTTQWLGLGLGLRGRRTATAPSLFLFLAWVM